MLDRLRVFKTVLWLLIGVLLTVTVARFLSGLGAVTNLNDATPWGFWIGFDVMAGVALAAGGFVMAATVYIFGREKYHVFARPAILTAFLGYAAVATGLVYDLGLPWNIWRPMFNWQHRSVLFEVAMCVMLYLTVLGLEFLPVVLEHRLLQRPFFKKLLALLKKVTIVLIVAGIVLSTLHQSSLGSLFLITPQRLHPLWYSPIIYALFLVSAIGLGFMMVTLESLLSGYFFRHKIRTDLLSGLGIAAACVLGLYVAIRLGDLGMRGVLGQAFDGSWQGNLFLFELLVSAVIPALLLLIPRVRNSVAGLSVCSGMTVLGMILYRIDVCLIAFYRPETMSYFPSWTELAVSLGIVAGAGLIFIFFVENLNVYEGEHAGAEGEAPVPVQEAKPSYDPATLHALAPSLLADPRRYSLAVVCAAAVAVAFLPEDVWGDFGSKMPISPSRTMDMKRIHPKDGGPTQYKRSTAEDAEPVMIIDGNRADLFAVFPHANHVSFLGDSASCTTCHHQNLPADTNTSCAQCHRDMYAVTDTFSHRFHADELGGNQSCAQCHTDRKAIKSRDTATKCVVCHAEMVVKASEIKPKGGLRGLAPGYKRAMHGLCVTCHAGAKGRSAGDNMARCDTCHIGEKP